MINKRRIQRRKLKENSHSCSLLCTFNIWMNVFVNRHTGTVVETLFLSSGQIHGPDLPLMTVDISRTSQALQRRKQKITKPIRCNGFRSTSSHDVRSQKFGSRSIVPSWASWEAYVPPSRIQQRTSLLNRGWEQL